MKKSARATLAQDVSRCIRQALSNALAQLDEGDRPALTVRRANCPLAPALLADAADAAARPAMRALYERCLAHYRDVVRSEQTDAEVDDVGAAVAHFVAANMQALHAVRATPPMLLRLERQLAAIVRSSPSWVGANEIERQVYFEKMAILAVLIGETSMQAARQGPAAMAHVQRAARAYMRELLQLDPDTLALGPDGLALRPDLRAAA